MRWLLCEKFVWLNSGIRDINIQELVALQRKCANIQKEW